VSKRRFRRVLLKVSGNCFSDEALLDSVVGQVGRARRLGVELAVVMGGGNILRGRDAARLDRVTADRAGMLATVINGLTLACRLTQKRIPAVHLCATGVTGTVEAFTANRARRELTDGSVLVLSGGTGNPFFSTDSAAALRAAEIGAEVILKGTRVAGVYSDDPERNPAARLYRRLTYDRALSERLRVMDLSAFAFCMEHKLPIIVFDIARPGAIVDVLKGKSIGSTVC
jgi:uridylate kinase